MEQLNHRNILGFVSRLRDLLGQEFVAKELDAFRLSGLSIVDAKRQRVSAHPIAETWARLTMEASKSAEEAKFLLSPSSIVLLEWLYAIERAAALPNAGRMLRDVKTKAKFHSARHEAQIAIWYANMGYSVRFVPEGAERTADLVVRTESGEVFIECKSLQDPGNEDDREWGQFEHDAMKALRRHRRCWSVYVQSTVVLDHTMRRALTERVKEQIAADCLDEILLAESQICVQLRKIADPETLFVGGEIGTVNAMRFQVAAEIKMNAGQLCHKNPMIVGVDALFEPNQEKRLKRHLQKAGQQLPGDRPSLVHIDMNIGRPDRAFKVVNRCWAAVHRRLEQNHSRVNAVALSIGMLAYQDGHGSYRTESALIPNRRARRALPTDFSILGSNQSFDLDDRVDKEGTVLVVFSIHRPLRDQVGNSLLFNCSRDGLRQVRVWQTFDNCTRFEVFTPAIGRQYVDHNLGDMEVGKGHILEFFWSKDGVRVRLDHRLLL